MVSTFKNFCCGLALSGAAIGFTAGCGGDTKDDPPAVEPMDLKILFPVSYSAFGGSHDYQVPIRVESDISGIKWSFEPASSVEAVDLDVKDKDGNPLAGNGVLVTTKAAGQVTVTAETEDGAYRGTAVMNITAVTQADWDMGDSRYNNSIAFPEVDPEDFQMGDGGVDALSPEAMELLSRTDWSCANCHQEGSDIGAIEHTPMQTAGYSDEDLIKLVTTGTKPAGSTYTLPAAFGIPPEFVDVVGPQIFMSFHTWDATAEEAKGLVTYLRGLTPKTQGDLDFSSFSGGGFMGFSQ